MSAAVNVATRMVAYAREMPDQPAVVMPQRRGTFGQQATRSISFRELDQTSDNIARGLREWGVEPGTRLALLVPPSIEFVTLVFALFKAGVVSILIDPGMGKRNLIDCLAAAEPEGFVAIPLVHAVRIAKRRRFPKSRFHVTVGRRWFWGGKTLDELQRRTWCGPELAQTKSDDPAAIIFTTGSTGPPKGVLYRHGNFDQQVSQIQSHYAIEPGVVDLACFPLFGLFNAAMGVTTVIPDMDASRPARVDPQKVIAAIESCHVTQSFGSPAVWNRVGAYCREHDIRLPSLRRVFSAGAPVPPAVLETLQGVIADDGLIFTPYGATEALPVASISSRVVLDETRYDWATGAGTCVGQKFSGIQWRVIPIVDGPIASINDVCELPRGEFGELIVRGPVVTREYVTRIESNAIGKIIDGETVWHRMGDVGYIDDRERFWFCGRMAHRVVTSTGTLFTDPCEGIFNQHPRVFRSALVGVGPRGNQTPAIVVEPRAGEWPSTDAERRTFIDELKSIRQNHSPMRSIQHFLFHKSFPVDIRHNSKIFREKLAVWAAPLLK